MPTGVPDEVIIGSAKFRSKGRLPALSYLFRRNQVRGVFDFGFSPAEPNFVFLFPSNSSLPPPPPRSSQKNISGRHLPLRSTSDGCAKQALSGRRTVARRHSAVQPLRQRSDYRRHQAQGWLTVLALSIKISCLTL